MNGHRPRVSVVMPVYNAGRFLHEAAESILSQTLTDIELIAVDDGSTDGSGEILDGLARVDSRLKVLHQRNAGVSAARNAGIAASSADLVAVCDNDDLSHPERLSIQAEFLSEHSDFVAVGCGLRIVGPDGRVLRLDSIERWADARPVPYEGRFDVAGPTMMFRRTALEVLGGYRTPFRTSDDYDLVIRLIDSGMKIDNVPVRLYDYLIHPKQLSNSRGAVQRLEVVFADLSRELRRRGLADPLDRAAALTEVSVPQDLPIDVKIRLDALRLIAEYFSQAPNEDPGKAFDSGPLMPLARLRQGMGRRSWHSDVMTGIHRARYEEARSEGRWIAALVAGIDLWVARRQLRTSPDELILPRRQRTAAGATR